MEEAKFYMQEVEDLLENNKGKYITIPRKILEAIKPTDYEVVFKKAYGLGFGGLPLEQLKRLIHDLNMEGYIMFKDPYFISD